jgi:hypothetical protein
MYISFTIFTLVNFRDYASNLFDISFILALFKTKMTILYTHAGISADVVDFFSEN